MSKKGSVANKGSKAGGQDKVGKFHHPSGIPSFNPVKAPILTPEQEDEMEARVLRAQQGIKEILERENCIITVPTLNISSGKIWPDIRLRAQPRHA